MKCPICEGNMKKGKVKEYILGEYLGEYDAEICTKCGENFFDSDAVKKMEKIAKQKGIWGIGKKTKVTKTGNSLSVRIPKKIADIMMIKDGSEVYIHPEKDRIVIEKD